MSKSIIQSSLHSALFAALIAATGSAAAAPPTRLEYAKVIGTADKVFISRAKTSYIATDGTSKTRYRDAELQLVIDHNTGIITGVVILDESASPSTTPVFQPGLYKNLQNGCKLTMSNPTTAAGGRNTFTLATDASACGTYNFQAQVTTGAISGHPNQTVLVNSKCSYESSERAYGVGLNGTRDGLYPNEPMYLTDGNNQITVTGLYNYGNGSCQTEGAEVFTFCSGGVCP